MRKAWLALLVVGFLWPAPPTLGTVLTSISVDGNMSDWSAVLADPLQTTIDGPGGGLTDLDAPVQSTGRDLSAFAWTFDGSYFYMYVRRVGSSKNRQDYWFYLDTNVDGLLQTGEPVFHVSWWGKTRKTNSERYLYNAVAPGGDPMSDGAGFADGYTMPGTIGSMVVLENLRGGSPAGIEMECRMSWTQLGVPAGSPLGFHVATSNSTNLPSQVDDNLGGPGGGPGSTQLPGVTLTPNLSVTVVPGGTAVLGHQTTNTGNAADTFNMSWTSSGSFAPSAVVFHHDLNGNGQLDPGEPLLGDTDGDGVADTGVVASGATFDLLAVATIPAGVVEGDVATLTVTATSSVAPLLLDFAIDTLTVSTPNITLVKAVDRATAPPGSVLTYSVTYTSNGSAEAYNSVIVDTIPAFTVYQTGSATGAGSLIEFSHDGGNTYDASDAAPVTHIRWTLNPLLATGSSGSVGFRVTVQ